MTETEQDKKDIKNKKCDFSSRSSKNLSLMKNLSGSSSKINNSQDEIRIIDEHLSKLNLEANGADEILNESLESKNYILNNISFKIREGESCAFVGETGSGKSTIIRLL